jgi:TetR/AcrR family transcriptional regulator, mexJK operon transcriptional repressor
MGGSATTATRTGASPEAKRERVINAAIEVFIEDGYGASMDKIAAHANVAKQTLYNQFGSKDQLFASVIERAVEYITLPLADGGASTEDALLKFAVVFRERALSARGLGMHRALIAEAARFPKLSRMIHAKGPAAAQDALAQFLARAMQRGELRKSDPQFAAELLMSMLTGYERIRLLYGVKISPSPLSDTEKCVAIVDCFLRAFALEN